MEHIEQTLIKNIVDNDDYGNCRFVVLDYGSPDHLSGYLKACHSAPSLSEKLVVYSLRESGPFKMAHAKNMAHRLGILEGADVLVNLDADNYTGPGFASYVADQFDKEDRVFLWANMIQSGKNRLPRGISGRIVVSKHAFLNTGGYDEKYNDWGPDDKDFNARLRRLGYKGIEIDRQYLSAVPHNDKKRFKEYPHAATSLGEDQFNLAGQDTTIANFGKFGMGTVYRNFGKEPTVLGPVPTRIFGIGMHKTATTSLHTALGILGFDSAHWKSAHWAKAIWEEMQAGGRSRTLERSYALSDLPIPILFKELDKAYPGLKFILTFRNEEEWLESVRKHWSHEHNRFRGGWSNDPFTHRVHKLVYGQKGFDADLFLKRYIQHNTDVMNYFTLPHRSEDLLVLCAEQAELSSRPYLPWQDLCSFLKVSLPSPLPPYPHRYASWEFKKSSSDTSGGVFSPGEGI